MYRKIEKELIDWKNNKIKMPFMLVGARQTGKTYILDKFASENFDDYLYINLEKNEEITSIFERTLDPSEIIKLIEIVLNRKISDKTIIFFDEIQVSERAISSLKYFCEAEEEYKIITAGSLLGVKINRFSSSFPVGKVIINYLYPMDFEEFLIAIGENMLVDSIKSHYQTLTKMDDSIHAKAIKLYKNYMVMGGMPCIINDYIIKEFNIAHVDFKTIELLISAYLADMNKYTENTESIKNAKIYNSIPNQLALSKNFKYSLVDSNARKIRYESSLDWLLASNMIIKSSLTNRNESPLKAFVSNEKFKIYLSDVGMLRVLANIDYSEILLDKNEMFNGVLAENYVAIQFYENFRELYYYNFDRYEIDFIINIAGDVIPVEVKAGVNTFSKSLNEYILKYKPKYSIRLSLKNFGFENNIKSIPLYATFCIKNV